VTGSIIVLSLAYALVAALLLNLNLATRFNLWIKGGSIALVTLLYVGSWNSFQGLTGWATAQPMPEEFRVLWITMDEQDKQTGEPGTIYFWVRELDEAGLPFGVPRAHQIAWSEEAAEAAQEALARMDEGELLNGRLGRNVVAESDPDEAGLDYAGQQTVAGAAGGRPDFEFVKVQPPTLPPKSVPGG
jgi:hypothetical protein